MLMMALMMSASLAGCLGGDDQPVSAAIGDGATYLAQSEADLPTCDDDVAGRLYYVAELQDFRTCTDSGWSELGGAAGQVMPGLIVLEATADACGAAGGQAAIIVQDLNGDGVANSTEPSQRLEVCNGAAGENGASGADGETGQSGADGADGSNGTDGADGVDGMAALVETSDEPAGEHCARGGVKIDVGVDDNSDGALQSDEIDDTRYVCDGGSSATSMLTEIVPSAPAGYHCPGGARTVMHGTDSGAGEGVAADGFLQEDEVEVMTVSCAVRTVVIHDYAPYWMDSDPDSDVHYSAAWGSTFIYPVWNSDIEELVALDVHTGDTVVLVDNVHDYGNFFYTPNGVAVTMEIYNPTTDETEYGLYLMDGTVAGTTLVTNFSGDLQRAPNMIAQLGDRFIFNVDSAAFGQELWASNLTDEGTVMLADIVENGSDGVVRSWGLVRGVLDGADPTLLFMAQDNNLWRSNGTPEGTEAVTNWSGRYSNFAIVGTVASPTPGLIYHASDEYDQLKQLWFTDGTENGTQMLVNQTDFRFYGYGGPWEDAEANDGGTHVVFNVRNGTGAWTSWRSDGTVNGTAPLPVMEGLMRGYVVYGTSTLFMVYNGSQSAVYTTDGTDNGTTMLMETDTLGTNLWDDPAVRNNLVYFASSADTNAGLELWSTDGTASGTAMVVDLSLGTDGSYPEMWSSVVCDGALFFEAETLLNDETDAIYELDLSSGDVQPVFGQAWAENQDYSSDGYSIQCVDDVPVWVGYAEGTGYEIHSAPFVWHTTTEIVA